MTRPVSLTTEFYTVVYRVKGNKTAHDEWWQGLRPMFLADNVPVSITTIIKGDLAARVEELEGGDNPD